MLLMYDTFPGHKCRSQTRDLLSQLIKYNKCSLMAWQRVNKSLEDIADRSSLNESEFDVSDKLQLDLITACGHRKHHTYTQFHSTKVLY